ncbi:MULTISPECIES: thiol reductant ABC exporter subunit CydD [unclassified Adlercreutzia]|uniref:thiol reductant ABC exporter subunit CydD n=1 Tax=unclassified Adlercreutzia TaxID=2636013 RepID=UPI0013ED4794|nr:MULTISPECIES: thiol reductant ABC exporter subunit CydD [unclassified Adlercreutzia]
MFDRALLALPGARGAYALTGALTLARALAVVGQAWALASFIVGVWAGSSLAAEAPWLAAFLACFVGRQVILAAQDAYLDRYAYARAHELRERALRAVFAAGPRLTAARGSGAVVADVVEGVDSVETYVALIIPKMSAVVIIPLVLLLAIFPLDWVSGLIALVCFPFIILYMVMIGHTASDEAARRHAQFQVMSSHFVDSVRGIDTLKAFGLARAHSARIFAVSERFREVTMKTLRIATLSSAVLDAFATLALAAVAIMLGFRLVDGDLAFFPALAVLILVPEYFKPIREFAADYHATLDGKTALAALGELIAEGEGLAEGASPEAAPSFEVAVQAPAAPEAAPSFEAPAQSPAAAAPSLVFSGVGFSYPDFEGALSDVSFSFAAPCKVAVVGASGSGKSTLLSLIGGFADPTCGTMRAAGALTPTLRTPAWQRRVAYIPQDPYVFHASVRDNVAFYRPDATDVQVREALAFVGLDGVVDALERGVDEPIGAGARELSGGQAQRIALARAFLARERDVLLLDEPTAHLDIETELELKQHMLALMEGRLAFVATHRLHWVADADYVLVMEGGRVAWQGTTSDARAAGVLEKLGGAL